MLIFVVMCVYVLSIRDLSPDGTVVQTSKSFALAYKQVFSLWRCAELFLVLLYSSRLREAVVDRVVSV